MDLDGARNAKAEAFERAFGYRDIPIAATAAETAAGPLFVAREESLLELAQDRQRKIQRAPELIALGVLPPLGHNRNPKDHGLGIFIQQKRLIDHPIVETARRISLGECRVIYTGPAVRRSAANGALCRPLRIGASIAHHRVTAGTLGCFARKRDGGGIGMLSNNHIFADTNRGQPGDRIIQPARLDGGDRKEASCHVGSLHKFVRIDFDPGTVNYVDCAFAYLLDGVETVPETVESPDDASEAWSVGPLEDLVFDTLPVKKVGRTTKLTRGVIEAIEVDNVNVKMQLGSSARIARFDNQLAISSPERAFSKGGDSGSMIFTEDGRPVGLLFAGTNRGGVGNFGITYANPIAAVLEALNIDIHVDM